MGGPPAQSTRTKVKEENKAMGQLQINNTMRTADFLDALETAILSTLSIRICVEDGGEFVNTVGCTDTGSDESILSHRLGKRAVLNGIAKKTNIEKL